MLFLHLERLERLCKFLLVSSFIYVVKMLLDPKYRTRIVGMVLKSVGVIYVLQ